MAKIEKYDSLIKDSKKYYAAACDISNRPLPNGVTVDQRDAAITRLEKMAETLRVQANSLEIEW